MINVNGINYYIDIEALNQVLNDDDTLKAGQIEDKSITENFDEDGNLTFKSIQTTHTYKPKEVDGFKYEMYMNLIKVVMETPLEPEDSGMPFDLEKEAPINFTIAFNTLLYNKILKSI